MTRTPFHVTPLILDALAVLVNAKEPLSSREVAHQMPGRRYDYITKALSRMHTTGWLTCESTPRPSGPPVMGYALKESVRDQSAAIVKDRNRPKSKQPGALDPHKDYLSTACRHEIHKHCRSNTAADGATKEPGTCKFCEAKCICYCHPWNTDTQ